MGGWGSFTLSLILAVTLLCPGWTKHGIAHADQRAETSTPSEYHTPLAGEALHTVFLGTPVDIAALDRGRVR